MIDVQQKDKKIVQNPLMALLQGDKKKSDNAFANLLKTLQTKGVANTKEPHIATKNTKTTKDPLVLKLDVKDEKALKTEPKTTKRTISLENFLQKLDVKNETKELQPDVQMPKMSELKASLSKAKDQLRDMILNSPEYKSSKLKELPNNTRSLLKIAKELNLDLSSIKVESLSTKSPQKAAPKAELPISTTEVFAKTKELKTPTKQSKSEQNPLKTLLQSKEQVSVKEDKSSLDLPKTELKVDEEKAPKVAQKLSEPKEMLRTLISGERVVAKEPEPKTQTPNEPKKDSVALKEMPKAMLNPSEQNFSDTQQGDQSFKESSPMVATASKDVSSLDVKIAEAKQMIRYLSDDIKKAIDDYKPPISRIKVQLNPAKLGEMELSVTQRGKNIIVNLSSNNTAINLLNANLAELRVQLQHSGINSASFHLSSNGAETSGGFAQQQREQQHKKAQKEYNFFSKDELEGDEVLASLEITIPRYA